MNQISILCTCKKPLHINDPLPIQFECWIECLKYIKLKWNNEKKKTNSKKKYIFITEHKH